jgi:hypothetical protein
MDDGVLYMPWLDHGMAAIRPSGPMMRAWALAR